MPDPQIGIRYDRRFGEIVIYVSVNGQVPLASGPHFVFSVPKLIKELGIRPEELRAYTQDMQNGQGMEVGDIEPTRHRVLHETDWKGKIVLDVGGYDGFAARIALDHGAKQATCIDNHQYEHYGWQEKMLPGVRYVQRDVMEWVRCVDVVIFYNVLYHVKNPWRLLDHLRHITKREMLLCTLFRYSDLPTWYLYEERECNAADETVFWGPSILGLERMLKATGWTFKQEGLAMDRVAYRCWPVVNFVEKHGET